MTLLTINPDKCNRDGICAEVCPIKIIYFKDKESLPIPVPGADKLCIRCGHCVAVCPTGAMSHEIMSPEKCLPVYDGERSLRPRRVFPSPPATEFAHDRRWMLVPGGLRPS